jgi:1,4-alpha-glucan branching enzyme
MPGDPWQQFANLRALLAYQYTRPGKPLLFMGSELGSRREWNHDGSLDWHLAGEPPTAGLLRFLADLGALYRARAELWRGDPDLAGFQWLDADDRDHSIYGYLRRDGDRALVVLLNLTPVPRADYRAGAPAEGRWSLLLSSDHPAYGGGGYGLVSEGQ